MAAFMHIENLYREPGFLVGEDREVYALEKIHGTSAHLRYVLATDALTFYPGGEKLEPFTALFDAEALRGKLAHECRVSGCESITVYGEAYGGKCQGMSDTYGPQLRFVAFDVRLGDAASNGHLDGFLDVPDAWGLCRFLRIDFVHWERLPLTIAALDAARDADSTQAIRNGCGPGHKAEGIVIRPLRERRNKHGARVILKHKRAEFRETKTPRSVDLGRVQVLADAQAIADEWVTGERLNHVLDHLRADRLNIRQETDCEAGSPSFEPKDTPDVIRAMLEDVRREGAGEIEWSKEADRAVATATARLFKARVMAVPA